MTRLIDCPSCAAMKAFRDAAIKQKGWKAAPELEFCSKCRGSGKVRDDRDRHHRDKKRRKDMSGEEWTEADSRWEREREYMEREE